MREIAAVAVLVGSLGLFSCSTKSTSPSPSNSSNESRSIGSPPATPSQAASEAWVKSNAASLTLTIKSIGEVALDHTKFPERDYSKRLSDAMQKDYSRWIYRELDTDKAKGEIRIVLNLFRDEESSWPTGSTSLNMQFWGARSPDIMGASSISMKPQSGPLLQYDLILTGSPNEGGGITGTATGLVIFNKGKNAKGVKFDNAHFDLEPFVW